MATSMEAGVVTATPEILSDLVPYRVPSGEGRTYSILGDRVSVKATAAETGGAALFMPLLRPVDEYRRSGY